MRHMFCSVYVKLVSSTRFCPVVLRDCVGGFGVGKSHVQGFTAKGALES